MSAFKNLTPLSMKLLVISALIVGIRRIKMTSIKSIIKEVSRTTEITTLTIAIIDILRGIDKDKRVEILKSLAEMYQAELDTGLAEDK